MVTSNGFQSTYEELKRGPQGSTQILSKPSFPVYLWGIETHVNTLTRVYFLPVSSLPMRNWNKSALSFTACINSCFQSTYEELKLDYKAAGCGAGDVVSSLPMRNWNQKSYYCYNYFICRFQSTYEELKPELALGYGGAAGAFPVYLWGIETVYSHFYNGSYLFVSSLPMRNWNKTFH